MSSKFTPLPWEFLDRVSQTPHPFQPPTIFSFIRFFHMSDTLNGREYASTRMCVTIRENEREKQRESERERERVRKRTRQTMCVCVRVCVCVCVCVCVSAPSSPMHAHRHCPCTLHLPSFISSSPSIIEKCCQAGPGRHKVTLKYISNSQTHT